jgi:RNA polymerase sigma-70 factor (ECF subfamily)
MDQRGRVKHQDQQAVRNSSTHQASGESGASGGDGSSPDASRSTLDELVRTHYLSVYHFLWRLSGSQHDAEELVQQTFLNAQRNLASLREADKARAWLFMIARNLYRRRLRDDRGPGVEPVPLDQLPSSRVTSTFEPLDSDSLQRALNSLPVEYREVLVLFYFRDLPYREIAEQMQLPIGTVMSRLSRGKQLLREWLKPENF